jgi:hypothetical protein
MQTKGKLRLFLLSLFVLTLVVAWNGISRSSELSPASEPAVQVTVPVPTLPIEPPPDGDPAPGGGGGTNTVVIAMLVGIALVAFVGLLLWVAARGRGGPM